MRRHFGLGKVDLVEAVDVRWPDGTSTRVENVKADQILEMRQP
jgi:hypothetical protein